VKALPDRPAFQPYWGKPTVRNDRGDRGNERHHSKPDFAPRSYPTVGILPDVEEPLVVLPRTRPVAGDGASAAEAEVRERDENCISGIFGKKHKAPVGRDVAVLLRGSITLAEAEQGLGPHGADPSVERNWRGRQPFEPRQRIFGIAPLKSQGGLRESCALPLWCAGSGFREDPMIGTTMNGVMKTKQIADTP